MKTPKLGAFRADLHDDGQWPAICSKGYKAERQPELDATTGTMIELGFSDGDIREARARIRHQESPRGYTVGRPV